MASEHPLELLNEAGHAPHWKLIGTHSDKPRAVGGTVGAQARDVEASSWSQETAAAAMWQ